MRLYKPVCIIRETKPCKIQHLLCNGGINHVQRGAANSALHEPGVELALRLYQHLSAHVLYTFIQSLKTETCYQSAHFSGAVYSESMYYLCGLAEDGRRARTSRVRCSRSGGTPWPSLRSEATDSHAATLSLPRPSLCLILYSIVHVLKYQC